MAYPSFKAVSKNTFIHIGNVKNESSREEVNKAKFAVKKRKKMKEMKKNLNRSNIHEKKNPKEDKYTFKIEPGFYSKVITKFKESGVRDEINDESAGTETPGGVIAKQVAVRGMEEQKGARVQSMLTWDVTDVRSHTIQPIMLQGGKQIGTMTTVHL